TNTIDSRSPQMSDCFRKIESGGTASTRIYELIELTLKKKYDYALQIVKSQYVVSSKIVKSLENTDFYELRISISSSEYRTILLAVDHDNFIQSKNVLLLNSFLKKDTKQYKAEIKKAENIVKRYLED
ncbi:MAG: type II toxin-antitoxin system RelE/ParE family toxin, partial [Prevotella sp.]|nr:type II toxin-antitoxin system RelE/ParE family toxin [Prevotella sp.]